MFRVSGDTFSDQYTSPNVSIEAAAFQPLFAFHNLRKFDFELTTVLCE
jgi:hypothetical protein